MLLCFDTETTGLPAWRDPSDAPHQPHLVQLAMILMEDDGTERAAVDLIIKPDGWTISDDIAKIHGITTDLASRVGVPEKVATDLFVGLAYQPGVKLVAHNVKFDERLMRIAMLRAGYDKAWQQSRPRETFCTMEAATPIVNLPPTEKMLAAGFNKPKAPRLSECIEFFFQEKLDGAHNALVDVRACVRVYKHLQTLRPLADAGDVI